VRHNNYIRSNSLPGKTFLRVIPKSKSLSLVGVTTVEQSGMRTDYLDTTTGDI